MPAWYVGKFELAVPAVAQEALFAVLRQGYAQAAQRCRHDFPRYGWHRAIGALRWYYIQEALLGLADDVLAPRLLSTQGHSHYFGLARIDDIYLTVSKVAAPDAKPPAALFREHLQSPIQMSWLEDWDALPPAGLCALLIHGPDTTDSSRPGFARVKFMDGQNSYLPEDVDLYRRFVSETPTVPRNDIERRQLVVPKAVAQRRSG